MKKILFFALMLCSAFSAFSQEDDEKTLKFGLGGALSLPTGDLKESVDYGVGFEGMALYRLTPNVHLFSQVGVDVFRGPSYFGESANLLHIPIMAGARFNVKGFFVGGGAGYGLWSGSGESTRGFLYSPQIGYSFGKANILAHYTSTSVTGGSLSYFGVKFFRMF